MAHLAPKNKKKSRSSWTSVNQTGPHSKRTDTLNLVHTEYLYKIRTCTHTYTHTLYTFISPLKITKKKFFVWFEYACLVKKKKCMSMCVYVTLDCQFFLLLLLFFFIHFTIFTIKNFANMKITFFSAWSFQFVHHIKYVNWIRIKYIHSKFTESFISFFSSFLRWWDHLHLKQCKLWLILGFSGWI